ncbi:MAG: hypothetical protein HeimC2_21730 [Candidatus Heimdallarchaeota archaeon LC_2]|nr:MAG: hypothetical protein HeimC2_21730 [Candidatus Heimdallarchaeota archaeon LC_2]
MLYHTEYEIKKCSRCFTNNAIIPSGLFRKRLKYCSKYCKAKFDISFGSFMIGVWIVIVTLLKFEGFEIPTIPLLDDITISLFDVSFAQLFWIYPILFLLYYSLSTSYSIIIIRKHRIDWLKLTYKEHIAKHSG